MGIFKHFKIIIHFLFLLCSMVFLAIGNAGDNNFTKRHPDFYLNSSQYGKLSVGFGATASALHDGGIRPILSGEPKDFKTHTDGDGVFFYTKLGYQADFFSIGKTAFLVDYGFFDDIAMNNNDETSTVGAQFVQKLNKWGTECYLGYRLYKLDRDNGGFKDINAILSGFRIKF